MKYQAIALKRAVNFVTLKCDGWMLPISSWELLFSKSKATLTLDWDIRELLRAIWKERKQGRLGSDGNSKAERFGAQAVASAAWVSNLISVFPCDG